MLGPTTLKLTYYDIRMDEDRNYLNPKGNFPCVTLCIIRRTDRNFLPFYQQNTRGWYSWSKFQVPRVDWPLDLLAFISETTDWHSQQTVRPNYSPHGELPTSGKGDIWE